MSLTPEQSQARADAILKILYSLEQLQAGLRSTMQTARIIGRKRLSEYLAEQERKALSEP